MAVVRIFAFTFGLITKLNLRSEAYEIWYPDGP